MINRKFSVSRLNDAKASANGGATSSKFQNIFNFGDRKVTYYNPKVGTNKINIIPYEIRSDLHPQVRAGNCEPNSGESDFYMPLKVHKWFGPLRAHIVCPQQFGQPCPICEREKVLYNQGDPSYKSYKPSKRIFYNVEDLNEPGTLKIFETSEYLFQKELMDEASQGSDEGFVNFVDLDDGKTVRFRASETQFESNKYLEFKSFAFEDRKPIPDALVQQAISFDEYINLYTYDEISAIMEGELPSKSDGGNRASAAPAPAPSAAPRESAVASSLAEQAAAPDPAPAPRPVAPQPVQQPTQQPAQQQGGLTCPYGHVCGKDIDTKPECANCEIWDKCIELS